MTRRRSSVASPAAPSALLGDIRALIEAARCRATSISTRISPNSTAGAAGEGADTLRLVMLSLPQAVAWHR